MSPRRARGGRTVEMVRVPVNLSSMLVARMDDLVQRACWRSRSDLIGAACVAFMEEQRAKLGLVALGSARDRYAEELQLNKTVERARASNRRRVGTKTRAPAAGEMFHGAVSQGKLDGNGSAK